MDMRLEGVTEWEFVYGSDLALLQGLSDAQPDLNELLHPMLPYKRREVIWAARYEMARTVEDVLARRTHALFLNARAAMEAAPVVTKLLAEELNRSDAWMAKDLAAFQAVAAGYVYQDG
jgi:glycerol-3-phosphate dehydrogenase